MDLIKTHNILSKLDVEQLAYSIIDDMSVFIADLNRKRLAETGKDSNDNDLQDYSEVTVFLKSKFGKGIGSIVDHTTLFNTGNYHKSIFSEVDGDKLVIDASDSKTGELENKYPDNLGLTDKEQTLVKEEFETRFTKALNELF